jgi:hypothetical protein
MTEQLNQKPDGIFALKDYLVLFPAIASAIAITYDVGYFSAFDLSYFSFFTLSEHIVFALQALPAALAGTMAVLMTVNLWIARVRPLKIKAAPLVRAVLIGVALVAMLLAFLFIYFGQLLLSILAASTGSFLALKHYEASPRIILASSLVMVLLITWGIGFQLGDLRKLAPRQTHLVTTASGELEVTVIRAGETGILFYHRGADEVGFVRWDTIKSIATKQQPAVRRGLRP